jgi:membrane protein implicated in regulation of membrane protease activity
VDHSLAWAVVGFVLVITELLTGTFYLLMLGVAAFAAAIAAWLGADFGAQGLIAAVVAVLGCFGVQAYRKKSQADRMPSIDAGMPASFESWIDAGARLARVRYRGTLWEAMVDAPEGIEPGAILFVSAVDGNTLKVTKNRPT